MPRELVSAEQLQQILNDELHAAYEDYEDCQFEGIMALRGTDEDGCNWSDPGLQCSGMPAEVCAGAARAVVVKIRAQYNLRLEE